MSARFPTLRRAALLLAVLPMLVLPEPSSAADAAASHAEAVAQHIRTVKQIQVRLMRQGTKRKLANARREAHERVLAKRLGRRWQPGERAKPAPVDVETPATRSMDRTFRTGAQAALVTPANVKANNSTGDAPNATQSETSIASWRGTTDRAPPRAAPTRAMPPRATVAPHSPTAVTRPSRRACRRFAGAAIRW
jgi:hypothetical protein